MRERLTAYETVPPDGYELIPAGHDRVWMDRSVDRSAYRCLPLVVANQAGWVIMCPESVRVRWDGRRGMDAVEVAATWSKPSYCYPSSHFGSGVVTWTLPWLFRTSPGWNLLVRGPANCPKDGVSPLEGLVETDWLPATFTMNWKITRVNEWIGFERGESLCMVVPQRRGELEGFEPEFASIEDDLELKTAFEAWCESRDRFNAERIQPDSDAAKAGWEKHYVRGTSPSGMSAAQHQTRLRLRGFRARLMA